MTTQQPALFNLDQIDALFRGAPAPSDELFPDEAPPAPAPPPAAAVIRCTVCTLRNAQARPGVQVCVLCAADVSAARAQLATRRELISAQFDESLRRWRAAFDAAGEATQARYDRLDAARRAAGVGPWTKETPTAADRHATKYRRVVALFQAVGEAPAQPPQFAPTHVDPALVRRSVAAAVAKADALSDLLTAESRHHAEADDLAKQRALVEAAEREIDALSEEG